MDELLSRLEAARRAIYARTWVWVLLLWVDLGLMLQLVDLVNRCYYLMNRSQNVVTWC